MWVFFIVMSIVEETVLKRDSVFYIEQLIKENGILGQIGNTPLLELKQISKEVAPVRIFAKAEWFNPGGSVKDRAALNMVLDGIKNGLLTKEKTILDATSGNTGVAYAMIAAVLGYKVKLTIPENAALFFKHILRAYGTELVYTDPQFGSDGAIREAIRIYELQPQKYFYPDQYTNSANWLAHYEQTGVEIIEQTTGEVTHFVAGLGTSGTFMGCGRRLKEFNEEIELISVQPNSPFHGLEGLKHMETSIVPAFYDPDLADRKMFIKTEDAQNAVKRLAQEEGLLVGISSGAALMASLRVARNLKQGLIVVIFADSTYKYFDQQFWQESDKDDH